MRSFSISTYLSFLTALASSLLTAQLYAASSFELAQKAAATVGIGQSGLCSTCHATSSLQTIVRWAEAHVRVEACFDAGSPQKQMACILETENIQNFNLRPSQLGFYSAGLRLEPFQKLLTSVYGPEKAATINAQLQEKTMMPYRSGSMNSEDFAAVSAWVAEGLPYIQQILSPYDGPTTCTEGLDPSIRTHLQQTARDSWQTRNEARGMPMFGCTADGCFKQQRNGQAMFPERPEWRSDAGDHLHQLMNFPKSTYYWTRASADGRFVAYGGNPSGIVDLQSALQNPANPRTITVKASYDPGFFPDDSAFIFQGYRTGICNMSLLKDPATTLIDFTEEACTFSQDTQIPLYQSIGASLDGGDYLAATGSFVSDPGEGDGRTFAPTLSSKSFEAQLESDELFLYPMVYDGLRWTRRSPQVFSTPHELDWTLAPSNRLLVSRLEPQIKHLAYNFYELARTANQAQPYQKKALGSLCVEGLKGNFSFDDRFFVTYGYITAGHYQLLGYESAEDPAFKALLEAGTANVFLSDLWTQKTVAVTSMGADQFALFPHFRSDGWIYFMVYDAKGEQRLLLASDAALKAREASPIETSSP